MWIRIISSICAPLLDVLLPLWDVATLALCVRGNVVFSKFSRPLSLDSLWIGLLQPYCCRAVFSPFRQHRFHFFRGAQFSSAIDPVKLHVWYFANRSTFCSLPPVRNIKPQQNRPWLAKSPVFLRASRLPLQLLNWRNGKDLKLWLLRNVPVLRIPQVCLFAPSI